MEEGGEEVHIGPSVWGVGGVGWRGWRGHGSKGRADLGRIGQEVIKGPHVVVHALEALDFISQNPLLLCDAKKTNQTRN